MVFKIFFILSIASTQSFALDSESIKSIIEKSIKSHEKTPATGIAISVFNDQSVIYQNGFGKKNREENLPVSTKTLFAIGSTTKAFTALDLKLLENDHLLNFTDKVQLYLPNFKLSNQSITDQATIEDLLSHRIGLPRHDLLWYLSPFSRKELFNRLQYLDFPANAEANFRKIFQYNNLLLMTAGLIVEEKTNLSWENFTQKNILDVLNMKSTYFGVPQMSPSLDLATPYYLEEKLDRKDISQVGPAGSIYSNAEDMTKWIQSFLQKKWPGQEDFFKARIPLINGNEGSLDYAYGLTWMINTENKKYSWYFHNGNIDGFSTMVLFSKELNLGIVVMVNQDSSSLPNDLITDVLLASLKEQETNKSPNSIAINSAHSKMKNISLFNSEKSYLHLKSSQLFGENKKNLHHPGYGDISISEKDGDIFVTYYSAKWKLKTYDKDSFNYLGTGIFDIPFKLDNDSIEVPFEPQVSNIHFE